VSFFDEAIAYFNDNYDVLAPIFVRQNNLDIELTDDTRKDILNMHDAMIGELKVNFSSALSKDRLYHRPCGFLND